jgi:hypothetical protein
MAHTPGALLGGADVHHVPSNALPALAGNEHPPQQCGRCRLLFEGDPTLHPLAQPEWWLCPPCRAILLGRTPHPHNIHSAEELLS